MRSKLTWRGTRAIWLSSARVSSLWGTLQSNQALFEISKRIDILHVHFIAIEVGIVRRSARDLSMCRTLAIASQLTQRDSIGMLTRNVSKGWQYYARVLLTGIVHQLDTMTHHTHFEGWQLNRTELERISSQLNQPDCLETHSPSLRCRSTIHPYWRKASACLLYRRSIHSPVSRTTYLALG